YRELYEEIGLVREDVELLGRTSSWMRYRLPPRYIRRNRRPVCIGQKQRWFLLRLARDDVTFAFDSTDEPEFDQWRWSYYGEPVREVIYFKRPVYQRALIELAPLAFPNGVPSLPSWWDEMSDAPGQAAASVE